MHPQNRPGELFAAFSRITSRAFRNDRLLSCPTLSKAPNYGQVLRRFLMRAEQRPLPLFRGRLALWRIALRFAGSNVLHLCFMALGSLYIRLLGWKSPPALAGDRAAAEKPLCLIDTFAVLPKVAKDGEFRDLYLTGLREQSQQQGKETVYLYRLYGSRNPTTLRQAFAVLAKANDAGVHGITELHLFTAGDWLRLLGHCWAYPFALARLIRSLKAYAPGTPESYIREALIHTAGQCVVLGEARRIAGFRLGLLLASLPRQGAGGNFPRVFSWYENQTLNKALQRGLAGAQAKTGRHVPVVGAQLFIWPGTLLNNYADDSEAALGLAPDQVLVNGPYFLPEGSAQRYSVGPSLRYGALFARFAARDEQEKRNGPLLVLLSYHPEETRRVLELVLPLAEQRNPARRVVYKFHPATRAEDFTGWLPSSPVLADGSLESALMDAGAVIGSGSGSLAEAAAMGIPVLNVEDPSGDADLGLGYLPEHGKGTLWLSVRTRDDIQPALASLEARRAEPEHPERVGAFRDLLFTEPTPEKVREAFGL